ncbi:MAG: NUDIX domain-containing protein [Propionibacteriaceae bacterium]|jgi:8-oxo-dGTP pyrophosphatase MutT (NUDIX family)|nr:NUDIX domain-containing protein [Propionibacteriaceae bacterium]
MTDRIRVGSAVLVESDGRVLLGQRGKEPNRGAWVIPGGGVHLFEHVSDAAIREIKEETGLDISSPCPVLVREIISAPDEHRLIVYSRTDYAGVADPVASSDLLDVKFFTRVELEGIRPQISPIVRDVLQETGWLSQP